MRRELAGDSVILGYLLGLFVLRLLHVAAPAIVFLAAWSAGLPLALSCCAAVAAALAAWPPIVNTMRESFAATPWAGCSLWTEAESESYFVTGPGRNIRCACPVAPGEGPVQRFILEQDPVCSATGT